MRDASTLALAVWLSGYQTIPKVVFFYNQRGTAEQWTWRGKKADKDLQPTLWPPEMVLRIVGTGILAVAVALLFAAVPAAKAAEPQRLEAGPGQTLDLYWEINLGGRVYLHIAAEPGGEPCADLWWIKWPFGQVEQIGRRCGRVDLDIPGFFALSLGAKLRAGGFANRVRIALTTDERVANSMTSTYP